ncbi:hypothetical protein DAPPUDRAFT_322139 [Daphnia pulex]|uniref:Uncharacterized protein n=1 Tax=Daphnia pulex TaxID=6669 RepID=E9GV28_DAPPU|nr:hypothetical protein DAPPUDRAFT_322139 [Daphnia pulex]|eukprot:EFX76594.1 hypothetical protein DAPPUDRAFT_322139 [Daphnia pulex]
MDDLLRKDDHDDEEDVEETRNPKRKRVATSDIIKILADNEAEREKSNTTFLEIMADLRQQGQQKNNLLERLVVLQESKKHSF